MSRPPSDASAGVSPDDALSAELSGELPGEVSAEHLVARLTELGLTVATGESLTAGGVAARLAEAPGASAVLRGGVIAYCNPVKHRLLGVEADLLEARGAVDPAVAAAMALGAGRSTGADVGVSTTGVAGPEPHQGKPVGTVHIGLAWREPAVAGVGDRLPEGWTRGRAAPDPAGGSAGEPAGGAPEGGDVGAAQRWRCGSVERHIHGDRAAVRAGAVEEALRLILHSVGHRSARIRR